MPRIALTASLAGAMLSLMLALAPAQAQTEKPVYGGTLNVSLPNDAKSLDPTFQLNFTERQPQYLIFNTLTALAPDFSVKPELADSWEYDQGGRRLVLHLHPGVMFQDGTAFDADAAKWNLDHRMDPKVNSPSRLQLTELISSVDVLDKNTLALSLKGAAPNLLGMLAQREGFMMSPTSAQKLGDDFGQHPVGTGPFIFKEWDPGNRIVLEKNPHYWEPGKPYLDKIVFAQTANPVVGVPRLMTKELDFIAALAPNDVRPLEKRPDIKLIRSPGNRWTSFQLRVDRPPYDNAKLRQAMAYALDRKRMVDIVMNGKADISEGPTPPGLWWFDPDLRSYPYDPAKAKALLAQLDHPENLTLTLSSQPVALYQQISALAQEELKAVGLNVRVETASVSEWYPQLLAGTINFLPIRWTQRPDPDGLMTYLFDSRSANNSSHYSNPLVDALLTKARNEADQGERRKLYFKAQELVTADLPYIPLFFSIEFAAMRDEVKNYVWIPDEIPRFRDVWKTSGK